MPDKFEEVEQINKLLIEERQKNSETVSKYGEVAKENDLLKSKLVSMGEDMNRLKQSVKSAFDEEEATKKNIKDLVTAMQSQLVVTQQKLIEKEKENSELLDILQKVKDLRYLEKFMPNGKSLEEKTEQEDQDEEEKEEDDGEDEVNDNLYESMAAIRSLHPGRDSLNGESLGYGMTSEKRQTRDNEEDFKAEYQPQMLAKSKPSKKAKVKATKSSQDTNVPVIHSQEPKSKPNTAKGRSSNDRVSTHKTPADLQESQTQISKSTVGANSSKNAIANKALNTIKKSRETIEKIQRQGDHKKKAGKSKEPVSDKLSSHEKAEVLSKMGMISEMTSVLKSFESKIKQMQADMSRLAAK